MSLKLRWVGEDERDRVGEVRGLCYGHSRKQVAEFVDCLRNDRRTAPGEWLLAERGGNPVGTATTHAMTMWVRGGSIACQGVAFVGTVKTERRRGAGETKGVGSAIMEECLRAARERNQVISALMPFRGSYYEHFGYGVVERRADWIVPLAVLPHGDFATVRFYEARDREALIECRQRIAQRGQADIERSPATWDAYIQDVEEHGFLLVDRHGDGPVRGWMGIDHVHDDKGPDTIKAVFDTGYEDMAALKRLLHFLSSLRDQYSFAKIQLPRDLPLNLLLTEPQMTHRGNRNHPTAEMRPYTRMQVRVLDHVKLLEAMKLPGDRSGKVVLGIRESEGHVSKIAIELNDGKASAAASNATADVEMTDRVWAIVALGDLAATRAAEMGLIAVTNRTPLGVLDALSVGAAPYCREYF
jgi:predicted acetyltransferase